MLDSGYFYDSSREQKRAEYFKKYSTNDGTTDLLIDLITDKVVVQKNNAVSILDLGTGNGFLLREVVKKQGASLHKGSLFIGIDTSADMIELAQKENLDGLLEFKVMDNAVTTFSDDQFDFIIAKAVSNIDAKEVTRILKPGGWFVYKEYGSGKGLVELLAPHNSSSTMQRSGAHIVNALQDHHFNFVEMRQFSIAILRTKNDVEALLRTMRILPNGLALDSALARVATYYTNSDSMLVHSDPFIILGQK